MRDAGWLGEAARPGRAVEASSLAVLPFASAGAYVEPHVSAGLSDELRNQFSRLQSLRVTARSSSIAFEGQSLDAVTIAGKLAVAALLEGTVGRSGGRMQVSVQLIDGRNGKVMWAERYARPDKDLLAVQTEIANAVVAAVLPRFAASGQAAPLPPTEDPVAYDLYLLGRQRLREGGELSLRGDTAAMTAYAQAIDRFGSAIAADPRFAQAYASRAAALLPQALERAGDASGPQAAEIDREVVPDIERALALDPRNAEAYFVKGRLLRNTHRTGAEEAYRRAVELDPSHAAATLSLGYSAMSHGRIDERHRLALHARDLDPMDLNNHEAVMMSAGGLGRADELRASVERMQSVFPDHPRATGLACQAWLQLGQPDEALGDDAQALRFYERSGESLSALRLQHDVPGLEKTAAEALAEPPSPFGGAPAYVLARAGLTSEALAVYRHAGTAALMASDQWFKIAVLHEVTQLVALLRMHGQPEEADRLLARLTVFAEALRSHGARNSYQRLYYAKVHALSGHEDAAIEQISLAVDALDSPFSARTTETELEFDELRHDPRFKAQMKRLRARQAEMRARLPETFRSHGLDWPPESMVL